MRLGSWPRWTKRSSSTCGRRERSGRARPRRDVCRAPSPRSDDGGRRPVRDGHRMREIVVNVDNFARAETDRMFAGLQRDAGGVNAFRHNRTPAPVDQQTVIRMNRDTLYSFAVVDLTGGATLTVPDASERYLSVMVVNEDHYVNRV